MNASVGEDLATNQVRLSFSIQLTTMINLSRGLLIGRSLAFSWSSMGRTSATQKEKSAGSEGMEPQVDEKRWTTQGAAPCWRRAMKALQVLMRSWFEGSKGVGGAGSGRSSGRSSTDSMRATMYPSSEARSRILNLEEPKVWTMLRPSGRLCTFLISSMVP